MDPLVTAEEFASYLQRDLDRATAELAIGGASGVVRNFCRWNVARESATFTLDAIGSTLLVLPTLKLVSVDEVRVGGDVLDASAYTWSQGGQLYAAGRWPVGHRLVEVDVVHGYEPVPDEVKLVTCALAARSMVNPEGLRSKTVGTVAKVFVFETIRGDLSELEASMISGHRLP